MSPLEVVCRRCWRPVERIVPRVVGKDWARRTLDVSCHGETTELVVTLAEITSRIMPWEVFAAVDGDRGANGYAATLCTGPYEQVLAVRAKADDLFGGVTVSSVTIQRDRHRATFHIADERGDLVETLLRWVEGERAGARLQDVRLHRVPLE